MFKRLQLDGMQDVLAIFALFASLTIFLYFLYRMLKMKKDRINYLANLPLEEERKTSPDTDEKRTDRR